MGGPQTFFENSFLHFPQAKSPSAAFGTAMHASVEQLHRILKLEGELPDTKRLQNIFVAELEKQRLSKIDFERLSERGKQALAYYLKEKQDDFLPDSRLEVNFRHQGVVINGIQLTGKIDKIEFQEGRSIKVCDFKTGKCFRDWEARSDSDKIKLHNYRRQLTFYRILVENSNDFKSYTVSDAVLEFLEPEDKEIIDLSAQIEDSEVERLKSLVTAVGVMIKNLEFPPIDEYPKTYKGVLEFEDWVLSQIKQ
jgi:DNA helicase-2/ATP-dependent DNA helicase PcrA